MANPLTAGTLQISAQTNIAGAMIAAQGTAPATITSPSAGAVGTGQEQFDYGTASGQCDILCAADYLMTTGASLTLDIYTGTDLPNVFGGTAPFRKLKAVFLGVLSGGDAAGVTIGNAASNGNALFFGAQNDTWTVFPGGVPLQGSSPAGVTVDATHKNVLIHNNSAVSVTVRFILGGTSV